MARAKSRYIEPCPECGQYKYPDSECDKCEVRQEIAMRNKGKYGEPWSIACRTQRSIFIDNANGITVASVAQMLFDDKNNAITAERIVACVNACDGMDAAALAAVTAPTSGNKDGGE